MSSPASLQNCHILFLSQSEKERLPRILGTVRGVPVLTVSETRHFLEAGGMINFVHVDGRVRFEINEAAAQQGGLKISSQLLALATRTEAGH
jgi:hypothetical protein